MNKFAFFFPAKIVFAERNIELQEFVFTKDGKYLTLYLGPIGKNIWFSTDKGKIIMENSSDDMRQILIKTGDCYSIMQNLLIANIEDFLTRQFEFIEGALPKWQAQINNPELYEQEATERREKIKAERAIRDAEIEKRNQERAEKAQQAYENSLIEFSAGKMIPWADFERATKQFAVSIPIKTLGFGRKNVANIGYMGYSVYKNGHNSPVLWRAMGELKSKMLTEKMM